MKTSTAFLDLILAFGLVVSFLACSSNGGGDDDSSRNTGDHAPDDDAFGDDDATDDDIADDEMDDEVDDDVDDDLDDDVDDDLDDDVDDDIGDDDIGDDDAGGTWIDTSSGLTWQATPSTYQLLWDDANAYCDNLALDGGGWHLPTISEFRTLVRGCEGTVSGGSCGVTDSCLDSSCQDESCTACIYHGGPNNGCYWPSELPGECHSYWSSSLIADITYGASWYVDFQFAYVNGITLASVSYARCVR